MDHPSSVAYNKGNLEKYQSGNPLKKYLVKRFDDKLMNILLNI